MEREQSTTKWGRCFVNERLFFAYKRAWLELEDKPRHSVAKNISKTIYPDGTEHHYKLIKIENSPGCAVLMGSVASLITCKDTLLQVQKAKVSQNYNQIQNYPKFKSLYDKALRENERSFFFDDTEVLVDYAKYVVEYVEERLKVTIDVVLTQREANLLVQVFAFAHQGCSSTQHDDILKLMDKLLPLKKAILTDLY